MTKVFAALLATASLAVTAAAQPGAVPLDVFLEQRVAEELAADGTILSRSGVALDVEIVGDSLIVSLVDPGTRRAVASTKMDSYPTDREAAVAAVTQVAANLTNQLQSGSSDTAVFKQEIERDRATHDAEYKFRQEAISFGDEIAVTGSGKTLSVENVTVAYQGEMRRKLSQHDFYELVGRDDLATEYDHRKLGGTIAVIGGGALAIIGISLYAHYELSNGDCTVFDGNYDQCVSAHKSSISSYRTGGLAMVGIGAVGAIVGAYFLATANPLDQSERYGLAAEFNQRTRLKYGLSTTSHPRASTTKDVVVTPVTLGDGGGFAVMGRF